VLCDRNGLPLHAHISGANAHDSTMLAPLLDTNPGVREHHRRPGRPRRRPDKLHADKGYDYPRCRRYLYRRGIRVRIARRGIEDKTRLGRLRWVVERTMSWLLSFRPVALRYDRMAATLSALLSLACALICHRRLP
jgi:transposase